MSISYHSGYKSPDSVPFSHFVSPMREAGEAVNWIFAGAFGFAGKLARAVHVKMRARASMRALAHLEDHELADIGIHRSEIAYLAHRVAEDPTFDHRKVY